MISGWALRSEGNGSLGSQFMFVQKRYKWKAIVAYRTTEPTQYGKHIPTLRQLLTSLSPNKKEPIKCKRKKDPWIGKGHYISTHHLCKAKEFYENFAVTNLGDRYTERIMKLEKDRIEKIKVLKEKAAKKAQEDSVKREKKLLNRKIRREKREAKRQKGEPVDEEDEDLDEDEDELTEDRPSAQKVDDQPVQPEEPSVDDSNEPPKQTTNQ
eukprot:TRINITY_DN972_c0_g1_i1.p1 TRINITY_DN972_c0_g1~~TRINITY_DN972_c0_g1_i1.p1  ORF type:complete len:211 (-),score=51.41 TRINITY_DN972_c0_g1_i1:11-643(-)